MISALRSVARTATPAVKRAGVLRNNGQQGRFFSIQFVESHEWIKATGSTGVVGISHHAQDALGDVVYCELPEVGETFEAGEVFGSVESVKASSDVYAPVTGEVIEINEALEDNPGLVNESPTEEGWFIKMAISDDADTDDLMDEAAYTEFLNNQ